MYAMIYNDKCVMEAASRIFFNSLAIKALPPPPLEPNNC